MSKKYIGTYERAGVTIENGIPALVSQELFDKVQVRMKKNQKAPGRRKSPMDYLLTLKLFCGKCGNTMIGESGTGRSQVYYYYKCSNQKRFKACHKKTVQKDYIERLVVEKTKEMLTDEVIDFISNRTIEIIEYEKTHDEITVALKQNLKETEKSINNIMKAIEQGIITDTTKQRLVELEELKKDIESQILGQKLGTPDVTKEQIIFWLSTFQNGDINDIDYQRRIIDTFVNAVFIYDDKVKITYNYTDRQNQVTLSFIETVLNGDCSGSSLTATPPFKKLETTGFRLFLFLHRSLL